MKDFFEALMPIWLTIVLLAVVAFISFGFGIAIERYFIRDGEYSYVTYTAIEEPGNIDNSSDDFEREMIRELIAGISSANITIEFDESGSRGTISISYQRDPVQLEIYDFTPYIPNEEYWFSEDGYSSGISGGTIFDWSD